MDEGVSALKRGDLALVIVDTDDLVAHLCETNGGNKTNISRTDHCNWNRFAHSLWGVHSCSPDFQDIRTRCFLGEQQRVTSNHHSLSDVTLGRLTGMGPENAQTPPSMGGASETTPTPAFSTAVTDTTLSEALITLRKRRWVVMACHSAGLVYGIYYGRDTTSHLSRPSDAFRCAPARRTNTA